MNEHKLVLKRDKAWTEDNRTKKLIFTGESYRDTEKFQEAIDFMPCITDIYYSDGADLQFSWSLWDWSVDRGCNKNFAYVIKTTDNPFLQISKVYILDRLLMKFAILFGYFGKNQLDCNEKAEELKRSVYANEEYKTFQEIGLIP